MCVFGILGTRSMLVKRHGGCVVGGQFSALHKPRHFLLVVMEEQRRSRNGEWCSLSDPSSFFLVPLPCITS